MSEVNTITFDLELNVTKIESEIRRLQGIVQGYEALLIRVGLPAKAAELVRQMQEITQAFNSARRAIAAYQAAKAAAGDPVAVAQFALIAATFAMDAYDVMRGT